MKYSKRGIPLTRCSETMTEAAFFSWIRSHARRLSIRWKPRTDFLISVRRIAENVSNKRIKWEYNCNHCKEWFALKHIEVDHIIPVGSLQSFEDIGQFYERLLVEKEGYRCFCKGCHLQYYTLVDRKARKKL